MRPVKRFENKIALITASSTGIGYAIAERLAQEGATVIINSRSKKNVDESVEKIKQFGGKAVGITCHAGQKEDRKVLLDLVQEKFGGIDILVPNAAVSTHFGSFMETNEIQMDKMYDINFKSAFFLVQEALPLMKGRPGANVVVISSYAAYDHSKEIGFYSITQTMLVAMTKIMSKELNDDQIRVNCVAPGLIQTNFSRSLWEGRQQDVIQSMGLHRLGEVTDISNLVAFVSSIEAEFLNGETIVMAGHPSSRL